MNVQWRLTVSSQEASTVKYYIKFKLVDYLILWQILSLVSLPLRLSRKKNTLSVSRVLPWQSAMLLWLDLVSFISQDKEALGIGCSAKSFLVFCSQHVALQRLLLESISRERELHTQLNGFSQRVSLLDQWGHRCKQASAESLQGLPSWQCWN